ncbi:MAG: TlpA family protein disulfide reductase [candidate division KSB1 bacterium]|nr:TlpA family protein disulfide reductase [candidate division KSB1 bacterium]
MNRQKKIMVWLGIILLSWFGDSLSQVEKVEKKDSLKIGSPAATFFLRTLQGEEFYLSDYCGKLRQPWKSDKQFVVILSFFATWCQPCLKEIPELEEIAEKFGKQDLKVFLINVKEKAEVVASFVQKHQIKLPVLLDLYGVVAQKYQVNKLPRYVVIDKDGKVVLIGEGYEADFKEKLSTELVKLFEGNP